MAESPASIPLHHIMTEINGAKSQWEALIDRMSQGYGDAYKKHDEALSIVRKKRAAIENAKREALFFLFTAISMGFAGGAVGSLFAAWTKDAAEQVAKYAFREGVRGIASETAKKAMNAAALKIFSGGGGGGGLTPVSVPPWEYYLEKKTRLDTCFAQVNEYLTSLIQIANQDQWSEAIGQDILDAWRKTCPLLVDAPKTTVPPTREDMARGAEVLMWVAWCNQLNWEYWDKQYNAITFFLDQPAVKNRYSIHHPGLVAGIQALQVCNEFKPVMHRLMFVMGYEAIINVPDKWEELLPRGYYVPLVVDLRVPGKLVQWTHIIQKAVPAIMDVAKNFDKDNIPSVLAALGQSKPLNTRLFDGLMGLKPYYKRAP